MGDRVITQSDPPPEYRKNPVGFHHYVNRPGRSSDERVLEGPNGPYVYKPPRKDVNLPVEKKSQRRGRSMSKSKR